MPQSDHSVFLEQAASRLENVQKLWGRVATHLHSYYGKRVEGELDGIHLAFTEGLVNAIEHAHKEDGRPLDVEIRLSWKCCELRILDTGPGCLSPGPARDPLDNLEAESGRGQFLMKAMMDSVEYVSCPVGNVLTLTKNISN